VVVSPHGIGKQWRHALSEVNGESLGATLLNYSVLVIIGILWFLVAGVLNQSEALHAKGVAAIALGFAVVNPVVLLIFMFIGRDWCQGWTMKVFLDDERPTPAGWVRVYWPQEAIALLESGRVTELSLDHDLGDDRRGTGYDVILWIEEAVALRGFTPPYLVVHSANPTAKARMQAGIASIRQILSSRDTRNTWTVADNVDRFIEEIGASKHRSLSWFYSKPMSEELSDCVLVTEI
jgi:hypothetical protein